MFKVGDKVMCRWVTDGSLNMERWETYEVIDVPGTDRWNANLGDRLLGYVVIYVPKCDVHYHASGYPSQEVAVSNMGLCYPEDFGKPIYKVGDLVMFFDDPYTVIENLDGGRIKLLPVRQDSLQIARTVREHEVAVPTEEDIDV